MGHTINVSVRNKIAVAPKDALYICGNSDFVVVFDFDDEWAAYETKTARFKYNGTHQDIVLTGSECNVPKISNAYSFEVGVFAGDLRTTTPAYVSAKKSILCGSGAPDDPPEDVYNQIMEKLNEQSGKNVELDKTLAKEGMAAEAKAVGDALSNLENRTKTGLGGALVTTSKQVLTGSQKKEARSNIGAGAEPFFFDVRYDEATDKFYADAFWNGETKTITKSLLSNVNSSTTIVTSIKYKGVSFEGEYCGCTDTHAQFLANIPSENFTALISVTLGNIVGNYTRLPFGSSGGSGGDIALDTTLSIPGMAADAAAVGTAINQLSSQNEEFLTALTGEIAQTIITIPQEWDDEKKTTARQNVGARVDPYVIFLGYDNIDDAFGLFVIPPGNNMYELDVNGEAVASIYSAFGNLANVYIETVCIGYDFALSAQYVGTTDTHIRFYVENVPEGFAALVEIPLDGIYGRYTRLPCLGGNQGAENVGKLLYVGTDGLVQPLVLGSGLRIANGVLSVTGTVTPEETPVLFMDNGDGSVTVQGVTFEDQGNGVVLMRGYNHSEVTT